MADDHDESAPPVDRFDGRRGQLHRALADVGEPGAWLEYGEILLIRADGDRPLYDVVFDGGQIDTIDIRKFHSLAQLHNQLARYEQQVNEGGPPEWVPGEVLTFDRAVDDPRGVE